LATLRDLELHAGTDTITIKASAENGGTVTTTIAINLSATDFSGDGNSDAAWQNDTGQPAVWVTNGAAAALANSGAAWHVKGADDADGNARSDLLWQNDNGEVVIWLMDGTRLTGTGSLGNPGPSWHAIRTGDFNHDDHSDILFQNSSGDVAIWELNGTSVIA